MKKVLFVCTSHTLTPAQLEGWAEVVYVSADVNSLTKAIPADADLSYILSLKNKILAEACDSNATHFFCVGEPTLTMHCNLEANVIGFKCVQSTTERKSVDVPQPDGSILKTAVFQHVQWREMF